MDRDAEGEVQAETVRRFKALRRRYWRFGYAFLASWAAAWVYLSFAKDPIHPVARAALVALILVAALAWILAAVTWSLLIDFRCPRCGERFILARMRTWPGRACKHCGLDLG